MANNTELDPGVGGDVIRDLEKTLGVKTQVVVLDVGGALGAEAIVGDVSLPIFGTVAVSNFPATQPVSRTVAVSNFPADNALTDAQLRASAVPVSGPLTDTQLRLTPVPVSCSKRYNEEIL